MEYSPPEHRVLGSPFRTSCLRNRLRETLKPVSPSQKVEEQRETPSQRPDPDPKPAHLLAVGWKRVQADPSQAQ